MPNTHRSLSRMRIFAGTEYRHFKGIPGRVLMAGVTCFEHAILDTVYGGVATGEYISNVNMGVHHMPGESWAGFVVLNGVTRDPHLWLRGLWGSVDGVLSPASMRREIAPIQYTEPDGYNLCA